MTTPSNAIAARSDDAGLGWLSIVRLGLVQTALGAIVVLTTSTLNRVMVVELALPAMLPGALFAYYHALQALRPRWGYGSDVGGARTPWIIGGMAALSLGGFLGAVATAWMETALWSGITLAVLAFSLIGIGVGAAGTSLLALLAIRVAPARRAPAASIVWIMMIAGFVVTAGFAGVLLDPFSSERLVAVAGGVSAIAFVLAVVAVWGVEKPRRRDVPDRPEKAPVPMSVTSSEPANASFLRALGEVWAEPQARLFTIFVFVSMLAYSAQDLILEPFAGLVFGLTPGQSTQLSGLQHGGVLSGMIVVAIGGMLLADRKVGWMRAWTVGGCVASAVALFALAFGGTVGPGWPLYATVFAVGLANGAFAVAAIGSMMGLAGAGRSKREGTRMGLWGAAQAFAFGIGGFLGAAAVDGLRTIFPAPEIAYGSVFVAEGVLFLAAAAIASWVGVSSHDGSRLPVLPTTEGFEAARPRDPVPRGAT